MIEADFQREYRIPKPHKLPWSRFRRLLFGLSAQSRFMAELVEPEAQVADRVAASRAGSDYPEWQRRLDKLSGRTPGARTVMTLDQFMAEDPEVTRTPEGAAFG